MAQWRRLVLIFGLAGLLVASVGVASAAPGTGKGKAGQAKARIVWSMQRVVETLAPGQSVVVPVTLTSSADIAGVQLRSTGGLGRITALKPSGPFDLKAGVPFNVELTLTAGTHTQAGVIQLRAGQRNLPASLKVLVKVPGTTADDQSAGGTHAPKAKPAKAKPAKAR